MSQLQNHTISLGPIFANSNEPIFIIAATGIGQISTWVDYSNYKLWMIFGLCWLIFGIASYFKQVFYSYIFDQYKQKQFKPIDLMSLLVAIIQHISILVMTIRFSLIFLFGTTMEHLDGGWFCSLSKILVRFDIVYLYIGGLGIAIYRLLLIKYGTWIELHVGKKTSLFTILCGGIIITISMVVILCSNDYEKIMIGQCLHHPYTSLLQVLDSYGQSRGHFSVYSSWWITRIVFSLTGICSITTEIVLYIIIFRFIYKKDNSEGLRRLLEPRCIRQRNKTNAITFFGQFCSFLVEFSFGMLLVLISSKKVSFDQKNGLDEKYYFFFFIKLAGFTAISIVEVLTSSLLRPRLLKRIKFYKTN